MTQCLPRFPTAEGSFSVDYRSHNGIIVLGSAEWEFPTKWSTAGNGSIHIYNDKGPRVAVAPLAGRIEEVTAAVFSRADFTSSTRTPRVGEVTLLLNPNGYAAAIEIQRVTISPESRPGTELKGRFRILTDKSRDFTAKIESAQTEILIAAQDALATLEGLGPKQEQQPSTPGIGHNSPPKDAALTRDEYDELRTTLQRLSESASESLTDAGLKASEQSVALVSSKIKGWLSERFKLVSEGFYRQFGSAAALSLIALWVKFAGQLETVLEAIKAAGRALFGWH